ncbi:MAG: hypothetical protein ABI042_14500, partial [Verrucomicrobiota bacterium]
MEARQKSTGNARPIQQRASQILFIEKGERISPFAFCVLILNSFSSGNAQACKGPPAILQDNQIVFW